MLRYLRLRDFQLHQNRKVVFAPGVTTICGPSRSGKSALFRALWHLTFNQRLGTGDVRHGADGYKVTLGIDADDSDWTAKIGRVREVKGDNLYTVDGDPLRFDTVSRTGVPAKVQSILRLGPVNFQSQFDNLFWFSDGPAQVSRNLNAIIALSVIDDSMEAVGKEVRQAKAELAVCDKRLKQCEEDAEALAWVPEFEAGLARLEKLNARHDQIAQNRASLEDLLGGIKSRRRAVKRAEIAANEARGVLKLATTGKNLAQERERLEELVGAIKRARKVVKAGRPDFQPVADLRAEADNKSEYRRGLEHLLSKITEAREVECLARKLADEEGEKVSRLAGRIKVCPTCGTPLSPSSPPTGTCPMKRPRPERVRLPGT